MRDLPIDPSEWPGTPEYEEIQQLRRDLRESRAYEMMLLQEEDDYNHGYSPRRPGR